MITTVCLKCSNNDIHRFLCKVAWSDPIYYTSQFVAILHTIEGCNLILKTINLEIYESLSLNK